MFGGPEVSVHYGDFALLLQENSSKPEASGRHWHTAALHEPGVPRSLRHPPG